MRARKRATQGFTLVEVLVGLMILTLLMGFVVAGIGTATRVYRQETFAAQADVLSGNVERALSDPQRFMKSKTRKVEGKPAVTYRLTYNGTTLENPVLGSIPAASGSNVLYFGSADQSDTRRVKLLNEGIYGDCTVSLTRADGTPVDELALIPSSRTGLVTVNCVITSMRDANLSKSYTFSFVALGDKISKEEGS